MAENKMPNSSFVVLRTLAEVCKYIDKPYNEPSITESFSTDDFEREYFALYYRIRDRVGIFGDVSDFGRNGIFMTPSPSDRVVVIVIDSEDVFRPEFVKAIQSVLLESQQDYLVVLNCHAPAPGTGTFYICIMNDEVFGYADNPDLLKPFGFR